MPVASFGPVVFEVARMAAIPCDTCEAAKDCGAALPETFVPIPDAMMSTEIKMAGGVFTKSMVIRKAGSYVAQHSHAYPHVSVLVKGAMRVWKDGVFDAEYAAPIGITIPAGVKHMFQVTEDGTTILCVHDIGTADAVEIADEHHLPGVG